MKTNKVITSFNGWMLMKIVSYLSAKEGCHVERTEYTAEGARTIIQDSFGYRYEVRIETLSRLADSPQAIIDDNIQDQRTKGGSNGQVSMVCA